MYEKTLKGGKMVAKGSFGCVYDPPLLCNDENDRPQGYVAKILRKKDAESELREQAMIDKLDAGHHYHLKIRRMCVPKKADMANDKQLKDCYLHGKNLDVINKMPKLQRDYRLLHIENGGKGLRDYLEGKNSFSKTEIDTMLFDFTRIVFGLNEMTINKIGHFDIKTDNMVYNDTNNRFNYIDFGFLSTFDNFMNIFKTWGLTYWVFPIERAFLNSTDKTIQLKIFSNLYELAKSQAPYEETSKQPRNYGLISSIRSVLVNNLKNSGYRSTYRREHNVVTAKEYCVYGFNKIHQPNPSEEMLIKDYVDFMKTLMRDLGTDDKSTLIYKFNEENIKKLNVFSVGLVMNTMIRHFSKSKKIKVYLHGDENIKKTSDELVKLSPHLASFYILMTMVCHPSFPKRISSDDFYKLYLREVYTPIKNEYGFADLSFVSPESIPNVQPNVIREEKSSSTPVPQQTHNPQPVELRDDNSAAVQELAQELTRKVRRAKTKKRKTHSSHTRKSPLRRKECPPGKILNPKTNRCIDRNGAIAKQLRKDGALKKSTAPLHASSSSLPRVNITKKQKKPSPKPHNATKKNKVCPPDKILNPKTNRCIDRNGAMAKKLRKDGVL